MDSMMDKLQIFDSAIREKAKEYLRICNAKCGSFGKGRQELIRTAACIEMACRFANQDCDKRTLLTLVNAPLKKYEMALRSVAYLLSKDQLELNQTLESLCLKHRCPEFRKQTQHLLNSYQTRMTKHVSTKGGIPVNCSRMEFKIAAIYLITKRYKVAIDTNSLFDKAIAPKNVFDNICLSMKEICKDLLDIRSEVILSDEDSTLDDKEKASRDKQENINMQMNNADKDFDKLKAQRFNCKEKDSSQFVKSPKTTLSQSTPLGISTDNEHLTLGNSVITEKKEENDFSKIRSAQAYLEWKTQALQKIRK